MALLPDQQSAEVAFSEVFTAARFLHERHGTLGLQQLLDKMRQGASDGSAIEQVYGWDRTSFSAAWINWLGQQKWTLLEGELNLGERKDSDASPRVVEKILAGERRVEIRDFFHLGQMLRARGRNRAAVMEYQKAVSGAGPRNAAAWMLQDKLGLALVAIDRLEQARKSFEAALNTNPYDLEAQIQLGRLYLESDAQTAWLHFQEALRINPLDPRVQAGLLAAANQLQKRGEPDRDYAALRDRYRRALGILAQQGKRVEEEKPSVTATAPNQDQGGSALRVLSYPWAKVFLDYQDTGQSSPIYRLPVKPGLHWIGLMAPCSKRPLVLPVRVGPGETVVVDRRLCQEEEDGATTR
jgi:tetratricopeptide (TPR) repeat protein